MMDDEFRSDALDSAFNAFRDGGGVLPAPLGPGAARATVRRRRQARAGITGGLTALLIAAPVAAYAAGMIGKNGPPTGESATTPPPAPSASASPSPAPSPTPSATSGPPDGRIDEPTLKAATLTLPGWPHSGKQDCPAGQHQLVDAPKSMGDISVRKIAYVDVDSDGVEETAALMHCQTSQSGEFQVVVFDRDDTGAITTVGSVVATHLSGRTDGGLPETINDIRAAGNAVEVRVGDAIACCGADPAKTQWQWRAYSLDSGTFRQTGGPTTFPQKPNSEIPDPDAGVVYQPDLQVTSVLADGTTIGDTFAGRLRVTFRNAGDLETPVWVLFALPESATVKNAPTGCIRYDDGINGRTLKPGTPAYACAMGPVAPGAEITTEIFQITGPAAAFPVGAQRAATVELWASQESSEHLIGGPLPDLTVENNSKTETFTVT